MEEKKKHIAASGAKEGQWVACSARQCRNESVHVSVNELLFAQAHHVSTTGKKVPVSRVPVSSVKAYQELSEAEQDKVIRSLVAELKEKGAVIGGLDRKYYVEETSSVSLSDDESYKHSVEDLSWLSDREKQALTYFSTENFEWVNEALYSRKKLPSFPGSKADFGSGEIEKEVVAITDGDTYTNPYVTPKELRTREVFKETVTVLDSALAKTPRQEMRTVYRGVRGDIAGLPAAQWVKQHAQPGSTVSFAGYQSTSLSFDVASETYADENNSVIFDIETSDGLNISSISSYPEEQEVLLPRNRTYTVSSVTKLVRDSGRSAVLVKMIANSKPSEPVVPERGSWIRSFFRR